MFQTQSIQVQHFDNLSALMDFANEEQAHTVRIPMKKLFADNFQFIEDKQLALNHQGFTFNETGLKALCQIIGIPFGLLNRIQDANLSSEVLNDLISHTAVKSKLDRMHLVVDDRTQQSIGIVSKTYRGYSNLRFLQDLQKAGFRSNDYAFQEGIINNTNLTLRYLLPKEQGILRGKDGTETQDVTTLGLQLRNSMIGESSVFCEHYTMRRICSNGMNIKIMGDVSRVNHAGRESSFAMRLEHQVGKAVKGFGQVVNLIENLGAIEFQPIKLAEFNAPVFEVLPALKESGRGLTDIRGKNEVERQRDLQAKVQLIELIPSRYGGETSRAVFNSRFRSNASAWDFVNCFTEHAKTLPHDQRLDVEEKVGNLASWIVQHKQHFN